MVFVPKYILILFFLIGIDYVAGLVIEPAKGWKRKMFLVASLIANVGILSFFKYFTFAETNIEKLFSTLGIGVSLPHLSFLLPIGLSFHTFQSMSYTIEVYRGNCRAERHLGIYSLYVLFYPQMVAGPIERPQNLLAQFHTPVPFKAGNIIEGVELMLWGLFKKVVLADNLVLLVDPAFNDPKAHAGFQMILATYAFAFQIYCDFSGYTDIARGAARTLGYHLMLNFDQPYRAQSISEFWRRWHISLSTWFRDYVYFPLGGSRAGKLRNYFNLMVVFLISGLWHGASWAFILWGALHGFYMICGLATHDIRAKIWNAIGLEKSNGLRVAISTVITFHLVWIGWVFFRSGTLPKAFEVFESMVQPASPASVLTGRFDTFHAVGVLLSLLILAAVHQSQRISGSRDISRHLPGYSRAFIFCGGVIWILLLGQFSSHDFIYFQF